MYVGEYSTIRTLEIQFTWKSSLTGWVYLDFLAFYPVNYLPTVSIDVRGGAMNVYPPSGLPGFLSVLTPIKSVATALQSSTTVTVPAGQLYYVLTAELTDNRDTLRLGGANLYRQFGYGMLQIYQVVGSGESITFNRIGGTCRIMWVEFELPEFFRWYTDQLVTTTTPFPPSERHVGWIWDWSLTGRSYKNFNTGGYIVAPDECKLNVFKPWIHWGGFQYVTISGNAYMSGLFAEKEVI
jgi:hypothetical protein